ncbi:hypothetical protein [Rivularia sp. UHCC 0363]|uniref:hypothetical protein n=1 Tax=Rivularia sp. UHCC 0363 TaxID=3110244 RepID=UPI002B1F99A6|nr:hypothetical protein [Rivularia sp. UHCC 0363]MEA5592842.1 hypothetical protein [Rivularia sp. UHCC 0363]
MFIKAWPFLVTRNQSIDYKTVVAPDFVSLANIRSLLNKASDDDLCEPGKVYIRWIKGSKAGDFTIVFRATKARKGNIGESGNDVLKDPFGREIDVIEGLVFREQPDEILGKIKQIHLQQALKELKEKYIEFWNEDKISDSNAYDIDLREDVFSPIIQLEELEALLISTSSQLPTFVKKNKHPTKLPINRVRLVTLIITAIVISLLLVFFGNMIGASQKLAKLQKCRYVYTTTKINFDNQDASKPLLKLMKDNPKAWIFLQGELKLANNQTFESLPTQTSGQIDDRNPQQTITQSDGKLYIKHHPIRAAIALVKNQTVTDSKLEAIIVDTEPKNEEEEMAICKMNSKIDDMF